MADMDGKTLKNLDQALQDMNTHLSELDQWLRMAKKDFDLTFDDKKIKSWSNALKTIDFSKITGKQLNDLKSVVGSVESSLGKLVRKFPSIRNDKDILAAREFLDLLKQINAQEVINKANSSPSKMTEKVVTKESLEAQKKVTDELKKQEAQHKKNNNEIKKQKGTVESLFPSLKRLASAFGIAFSVRGLVQFGKKLIETRGEFERQQVALRSILQNKQLADEIWDKTMQTALQSPFTAMQLTTYTKQLAAYRIETDKLFETTKRLADVSAGLGVDMNRLILAYGQVKAANYLRASEIRQFTEAGVNVLGELRDYFNEVKGMSVDTAKVMEMVTKRLVTFEDVEAIFKRMTDAGGIFYDMQYVQSQTVRGQIAKLHDAYDQMLNNIGKANEGVLKDMVALLNNIVKNWREWKTVLDLIAWPLLISSVYKFSRGLLSTAASAVVAKGSFNSLTTAGAKLQLTLKGLLSSLKSNPWIAIATAVATATIALINHNKQIKAVQNEINEQNTRLYETELLLNGYQKKIEENNKVIKESQKGTKELTESQKDNKNILTKLQEEYPELAKGLKIQADGTILLTDLIKKYNDELERQITLSNILSQKSSSGGIGGIFSDTYKENLEQYSTSLSQLKGEILSAKHTARSIQTKMKAEGEEELPLFKILNDIADIDMSDVEEAAEKYRRIRESLWTYIVEGESEADFPTRIEKVQGADKYGFELPILSEFKMSSDFAIDAIKDNRAIIESTFAESLNSIDEYSKEIAEEYGGDIQAFISDNIEKINKGVESGDADVVSTIRTVFEKNGGATTKEAKNFFNKLLNYYLVFHDAREQIDALEAQAAAERSKKVTQRNYDLIVSLEKQKQSILDSLSNREFIDFFANKPSGTNGNQTQFPDGGNGKTMENASKLISLIKEMRSEYDKLSKSAYGYAKSEEKVRESYAQSVEKILGKAGVTKDYDFTTNEGMIKALEKVKSYATKLGKDAAAEVQKYIDQLETEIEINAQVKIREDFGKKIEEMFSNYDLTLDLEKLSLPTDELEGIFKFDHTTLDELREAVDDFYNQQIALGDDPTELVKQVEGYYKKIDEMEKKELRERLKEYSKYLADGQNEALKIHLEELKKMAKLDELYQQGYFTDTQYKDISNKIRKETDEKLAKNDWQQFKESDFYVTMFEDMSRVSSESIDIMIDRLKKLRKSVNDLNPKQAKEIVKALEKLEKAKFERSPLKSFFADWKTANEWRKNADSLESLLREQSQGVDYWGDRQKQQSEVVAGLRTEYEQLVQNGKLQDAAKVKENLDIQEKGLSLINEQLENQKNLLDQTNQKNNEGYAAQQRVLEGLSKGAQYFSDLASTAGTISTEIMDMFDGVSDASKQLSKDIAEIAANVGILAGDIVKAIASEGTDVGSMIDGLVRTWNIIKGIFSASEYEINDTIEKSTDALKDLEFELERVRRARERAWDAHAFTLAQKEIETNIYEQIEAYDALISAEEERKNKDEEQIRTWTQEREELFDLLEDERENLLKEFGGLGESEYKSAAQGFVDAWKSAFLETGDGLQGLQDHFDEFLQDWFVKQATMQGVAKYYQKVFDYINGVVEDGSVPTRQEIENARLLADEAALKSDELMQAYANIFGLGGEGSLSGLAAGIQGMTEEQANILEAYWNSVRGYTANIDMNVATIVGLLSNDTRGGGGGVKGNIFGDPNVETNPMLKQLDLIAVNTAATHRILESVTKSGHSQGGYGIKVFAD